MKRIPLHLLHRPLEITTKLTAIFQNISTIMLARVVSDGGGAVHAHLDVSTSRAGSSPVVRGLSGGAVSPRALTPSADAQSVFARLDARASASGGELDDDARGAVLELAAALRVPGALGSALAVCGQRVPRAALLPRFGGEGSFALRVFEGAALEVVAVSLPSGAMSPKFSLFRAHFVAPLAGLVEYASVDVLEGDLAMPDSCTPSSLPLAVAPWVSRVPSSVDGGARNCSDLQRTSSGGSGAGGGAAGGDVGGGGGSGSAHGVSAQPSCSSAAPSFVDNVAARLRAQQLAAAQQPLDSPDDASGASYGWPLPSAAGERQLYTLDASCNTQGELPHTTLNEATRCTLTTERAAFTAAGALCTFRAQSVALLLHVFTAGDAAKYYSLRGPPPHDAPDAPCAQAQRMTPFEAAALAALLAAPPRPLALAQLFRKALDAELRSVAALVARRPRRNLVADDCGAAEAIALAVAHMVSGGLGLSADLLVENVSNDTHLVLHRVTLFDERTTTGGSGLTVRLHLFPDASETYVHNHGGNFLSTCIAGAYEHATWAVGGEGAHSVRIRDSNGKLAPRADCAQAVDVAAVFTHEAGNTYFINNTTFHTVSVCGRTRDGGPLPTLTLLVKDTMTAGVPSLVLVPQGEPRNATNKDAWDKAKRAGNIERSSEVALVGDEKRRVLAQIEALLESFATHGGRGRR